MVANNISLLRLRSLLVTVPNPLLVFLTWCTFFLLIYLEKSAYSTKLLSVKENINRKKIYFPQQVLLYID